LTDTKDLIFCARAMRYEEDECKYSLRHELQVENKEDDTMRTKHKDGEIMYKICAVLKSKAI
jgi:hypothetical protein